MKKSFYAYISRLKHIRRWGLMRNTTEESVAEHSFDVIVITHALAIIHNRVFGGNINEGEAVLAAAYHETGEAITGDLPTPVKYFDEDIMTAYKRLERHAERTMVDMLPDEMRDSISVYVLGQADPQINKLVKAADKICAYIKCLEEKKSGNMEFEKAGARLLSTLKTMDLPEINYFMDHFLEGYMLTLDELN